MPEKRKRLEDLFREDEARKRSEQEAADDREVQDAKRRASCAKVLREIVIPVVTEYVARSQEAGHKAGLKETIEDHTYPSVELEFRPVAGRSGSMIGLESKLSFRCDRSGGLLTWPQIYGPSGVSKRYPNRESPARALDQVTREWVEEQLFGFMEAALKET